MKLKELTGERLKKLRIEQKISQQELAELMQVSQTTINRWETNKQEPSIEKLTLLAKILNVDCNYLLGCDLKTLQRLKDLTNDEYIYSDSNVLIKEDVTKISELKKQIVQLQNKNFKNKYTKTSRDLLVEELTKRDEIIEVLLSDPDIQDEIINIEYNKTQTPLNKITTMKESYCSYFQKKLFNEIIDFTEEKCAKLDHYIYHIKNETKIENLMSKIIYMNEQEINALEATIIGIKETNKEIENQKIKILNKGE